MGWGGRSGIKDRDLLDKALHAALKFDVREVGEHTYACMHACMHAYMHAYMNKYMHMHNIGFFRYYDNYHYHYLSPHSDK